MRDSTAEDNVRKRPFPLSFDPLTLTGYLSRRQRYKEISEPPSDSEKIFGLLLISLFFSYYSLSTSSMSFSTNSFGEPVFTCIRMQEQLLVQFFNKMIDGELEGIDFISYNPKNLSRVDVKVVMRNNIPHTFYLLPRNARICR